MKSSVALPPNVLPLQASFAMLRYVSIIFIYQIIKDREDKGRVHKLLATLTGHPLHDALTLALR